MIAKVPCPKLVPAQWITASEVATLEYRMSRSNPSQIIINELCSVKLHTDVPVPRILAWNSDSSSSLVKSEYIIMEKVSGVQLAEVWENMDEAQKYKLIDNLTGVEGQLAGLEFPGYGSLYHRKSIPQSSTGNTIPVDNEFCLGPAYSSEWYPRFSGGRQCDGPCEHRPVQFIRYTWKLTQLKGMILRIWVKELLCVAWIMSDLPDFCLMDLFQAQRRSTSGF